MDDDGMVVEEDEATWELSPPVSVAVVVADSASDDRSSPPPRGEPSSSAVKSPEELISEASLMAVANCEALVAALPSADDRASSHDRWYCSDTKNFQHALASARQATIDPSAFSLSEEATVGTTPPHNCMPAMRRRMNDMNSLS
jgi:hypothetical protein